MIRMAVIGVGAMGRNHARVCRDLADVQLVGIADPDEVTAQAVAQYYGVPAFASHQTLLEHAHPEAVIIAVPTRLHCAVATEVMEAGCHVLIEKPLAATTDEAQRLIALAASRGRVLAVGHVERHNPAIVELRRRIADGELGRVFQIHARRLGPFPARVRDVGVILDLATHDLDVMRFLTGSEPVRLYAEAHRAVHTSDEDLFSGLLRFTNGVIGLLEINWLTPTKTRELWVTGERGVFRADYLTQDLYFYENAEAHAMQWTALSVLRGVSEGTMYRYALDKKEPLRAEQEAFVAAIRDEPAPIVSGADGLAALKLALAFVQSSQSQQVLELSA